MHQLIIVLAAAFSAIAASAAVTVRMVGEPGSAARKASGVFESRLKNVASSLSVEAHQGHGKPESFTISRPHAGVVRVTGGDAVGLAYGIYELLAQIETKGPDGVTPVEREAAVRKRGMTAFLYNQQLESVWLYDRAYWERYFELLARSRLNYFTLVFGHQTSYLAPPFPFLMEVPGYERVRPIGLTAADRQRNLEMLRTISELAEEWGIRFIFGIWQQHAHLYGKNLVEGLQYQDLFDYCPKALALILKACPKIRGVQFRMNIESGIEENDQNRFYTGMAKAIRESGREVDVDFRAKGLRPETVESALALGIKPIVSTKYWREHMGMPFHGTRIDTSDKERSYRRYGYWDLLSQDRPYQVAYRMWTLGSTKLLLWGSLDYARQFARSVQFGDSLGFDVCAPLSQKGFGNWAGDNWRIMAKPEREYYKWEFERYWAYYLSFGLAGFAPEGEQPVLDAEFQKHFGKGAADAREAYEAASWVIPFVTATRAVSASNFGYWPEMETGGLTDRYIRLGTGDDNRYYRVDEYVDDLLQGRATAKMTPPAMARRLEFWAARSEAAMQRAESAICQSERGEELRSTRTDIGVLASLARYHAERLRSAVDYALFARTAERYRLRGSIDHFGRALAHWQQIARLTDGVYYAQMVFNRPPDQIGHWKDEVPMLEAELKRLREIDGLYERAVAEPEKTIKWKPEPSRYTLTMKWKEENGTLKRWADLQPVAEAADGPVDRYSMKAPDAVWREVMERSRYRKILHGPVRWTEESAVRIQASIAGVREGVPLRLFYRLAGTGFRFGEIGMKETAGNIYAAELKGIAAGSRILYYLQADAETAFLHGSAKEPHELVIQGKDEKPPRIRRVVPQKAHPGQPLLVKATVESGRGLATVRLHYRHLDQSEDWRIVEMRADGNSPEYQATIPGEFVSPGWDLMYAIEAVDKSGNGSFSPDWEKQDPAEVIPVGRDN